MQSRFPIHNSHEEAIVIDSSDDDGQLVQRPHKRQRTAMQKGSLAAAAVSNQRASAGLIDRSQLSSELPASFAKATGSYITPEPSHHAAEHEKVPESHASAQDEVNGQLAAEMEHLPLPTHENPLNPGLFASLRTPLTDLNEVSELKSSSSTVAAKDAVTATCAHFYNNLQKTTAQSIHNELRQARLSQRDNRKLSQHHMAASLSVFENLKPLPLDEQPPINSKNRLNKHRSRDAIYLNIDTWVNAQSKRKKLKRRYRVPHVVALNTTVIQVPQYSHFVRLQDNLLAPNMKMLHTWPYHGDEWQPQLEDYKGYYAIDVDDRYDKLRRLHQGVWLFDFAEATVTDLGISWQDVLAFLFAHVREEKTGDARADALLRKRDGLVDEECPLASTAWIDFASSFPQDVHRLVKASFFCENFQKVTGISAWHVVRRCAIVRDHFSEEDVNRSQDGIAGENDECRVCHRFVCETHGEIRETDPNDEDDEPDDADQQETEDTDSESESDLDSTEDMIARDIVNPQQNNFRKTIQFIAPASRQPPTADPRKAKSYWDSYLKPDDTHPSYPCHHPGVICKDAQCSCNKAGIPCSKYCSCSSDCKRKFQGCSCATRARKAGDYICFRDERCACYNMGRECDPDLCGSCGVCEVLRQVGEPHEPNRCHNASLQRGVSKHTVLGRSHVHEYGLYACELIRAHEFIGEYKGEIITKEEANRRGAVYEHQKMSYLFSLNKNQEVDSTFFGNKIRFINHSTQETRNVYAVIMMVNTVHRIAMFADRRIDVGEELYFDYGPTFPTEQVGGKEVRKSVPKARNTKLVETFAEPQPDSRSRRHNGKSRQSNNIESSSRRRIASSPSPSETEDDIHNDSDTEESDVSDDSEAHGMPQHRLARHDYDDSDSSPRRARKRKRRT